ncbi:MAG: ABC transporter substrate-binding protein [bacterium]|nr:MAG: ABC transporter substrate-binding protein [bacterium]
MSPRYIFRLIQAFFKRFKAIIFLGFVFGIIVFLFLSFLLPSMISEKQKIGIAGRYTVDNLPPVIATKISDGLTKTDENGNVIPSIAKSWQTTDGGKTWIFTLDENVTWQDEKKVLASEIKYEFNDAQVSVVDEQTIVFSLDSQFTAFPVIVSKPVFKKGLLGTGEWEVKDVSLAGGYVQNITLQNKEKDRLVYKFFPSEERLILGFKLGEIDIIERINDVSSFEGWKTIEIDKNTSFDNFVGIFLNTDNEKLAEKAVRQALNYAIDKDQYENRALGPISPFSWGYNPQVKPYIKDATKVEEIKGINLKISVLPNLYRIAESISKEWQDHGANTEVEIVTTIPENYEVFLATVDIPKDPDQYSLWHSTQSETNISKFKNVRVDKLLEDGRTELDQETRKKLYLDFQRFLVEEVPAIFLYYPEYYKVTRK